MVELGGGSFQDVMKTLGGGSALKQLREMEMEDMLQKFRTEQAAFLSDVAILRHRLRMETFGLLNPKGFKVQVWDLVTTTALFYTLFVTPYEIGLDLETKLDWLFICNQLVTAIFFIDIFVQFVLPVPDPRRADGAYERRHSRLAIRYLKGWFVLDVSTVIPFDVLVWSGQISGPVKGTKLLRVLRLLKMVKVLRASAIIQRWENSFAVSSTKMQLCAADPVPHAMLSRAQRHMPPVSHAHAFG